MAEPSVEVKRRVAADGNEPVQMKPTKILETLDILYGLGGPVYERTFDLRIATLATDYNQLCIAS